jgi:hypothetical protein
MRFGLCYLKFTKYFNMYAELEFAVHVMCFDVGLVGIWPLGFG